MAYTLTLTEEDMDAITFIGHRYCWSDALCKLEVGQNELSEHEAWELCDALEADTEGGHSFFPMLDSRSELADKLAAFYQSVI